MKIIVLCATILMVIILRLLSNQNGSTAGIMDANALTFELLGFFVGLILLLLLKLGFRKIERVLPVIGGLFILVSVFMYMFAAGEEMDGLFYGIISAILMGFGFACEVFYLVISALQFRRRKA